MPSASLSRSSTRVEVPEVTQAVHHIQELGQRMRGEVFSFADTDVSNIDEIIDSIRDLETEVTKAHDKLEAQTIKSSLLRHSLQFLPEQIRRQRQDAVLCAREANTDELNTLQTELKECREEMTKLREEHQTVETQNSVLYPERDRRKDEYEDIVAQLNIKMSEKAAQQIKLNETRDTVRETNNKIIDLEESMIQLKEDLIQERADARQEKKKLKKALYDTSVKVREQNDLNKEKKREMDDLYSLAMDLKDNVDELRKGIRGYESSRSRLEGEEASFRTQFKKQREQNNQVGLKSLQLRNEINANDIKYEADIAERKTFVEKLEKEKVTENKLTADFRIKTKRLGEVLVKKQKVRALDLKRNTEQQKVLQKAREEVATKEEEIAKVRQNTADMEERTNELTLTHEAVIATFEQLIYDCEFQLSKERKERLEVQGDKEDQQKEIDDFRVKQSHEIDDMNERIRQGKKEHDQLTKEGNDLRRMLQADEESMRSLSTLYEEEKAKFKREQTRLQLELQHLEESIQLMTEESMIKEKVLEEKRPPYQVLQTHHKEVRAEYDVLKKTTGELNSREKTLNETHYRTEVEKTKITKTLPDLKKSMEQKRKDYKTTLTNNASESGQIEQQISAEALELRAIMDENNKFDHACKATEADILRMFNDSQSRTELQETLMQTYTAVRDDLGKGWQLDEQVRDETGQMSKHYIAQLDELLSKLGHRDTVVNGITTNLKSELQVLAEFLDNISSRRPARSSRKPAKKLKPENLPSVAEELLPQPPLQEKPARRKVTISPFPATPATKASDL